MTATIPLDVLELACSRICHDLVSPIGAINNGVELCQDVAGDTADEAMALIAESGQRAAARLQAFRLGFGAAGGQPGLGADSVQAAMQPYFAGGKVRLDWPDAVDGAGPPWPAGTGRLLLLAMLLAEEALIHGGRVAPAFDGLPDTIAVTADGRTAALSAASQAALEGRLAVADLSAHTVVAYLAHRFATVAGITLTLLPAATPAAEPTGSASLRLVLRLPPAP